MILTFGDANIKSKVDILNDKFKFLSVDKNLKLAIKDNKELKKKYEALQKLKSDFKYEKSHRVMCEYDEKNWKFNINEKKDEIINIVLTPLRLEL